MTRQEQILDVIGKQPGIDNIAIGNLIDYDPNSVAALTSAMFKKGVVTRTYNKETGRYEYTATQPVSSPVVPPAPVAKAETPEPAVRPVAQPEPVKQSIAEHGGSLASVMSKFDEFATALARHLVGQVKGKIVEELLAIKLPHIPPTTAPHMPTLDELKARIAEHATTPVPTPSLKRVAIIGLLPQQSGMIQNEFHDAFSFAFFKDGPSQQLRDMVRGADHVITFTSKIPHHFESIIKSAGKDVVRNRGGMTELRDRLMKLYVEGGS